MAALRSRVLLRCRWEVVLDILDFVRLYCSDLHLAKKTKAQFGVLAFDLGEVAPDSHQPERRAYTEVKEGIGDTGPSGPWIVQNRKWSPVETLAVQDGAYALDRQGDSRAGTYGRRETICSERWLLGGLAGYPKAVRSGVWPVPAISLGLYGHDALPCVQQLFATVSGVSAQHGRAVRAAARLSGSGI